MPKKNVAKPNIDWNSNLDDFKNAAKNVGSGVNSFLKPGGGLDELTGANDVKRFIKNPSLPNLGGIALSATQYVGGPAASAIARGAGNTARYAARILPDEASRIVTKTLRLGNNTGQLNTLQNTTRQITGRSVSTERVVTPAQAAAGRGLAAANEARPLTMGRLQGLAAANFIRQTEKISNKKNNNKK
jgi:hypothetical protein